jgi:hypothetical protein
MNMTRREHYGGLRAGSTALRSGKSNCCPIPRTGFIQTIPNRASIGSAPSLARSARTWSYLSPDVAACTHRIKVPSPRARNRLATLLLVFNVCFCLMHVNDPSIPSHHELRIELNDDDFHAFE